MLKSLTYEHAAVLSSQRFVETGDRLRETATHTPEHQFEPNTKKVTS